MTQHHASPDTGSKYQTQHKTSLASISITGETRGYITETGSLHHQDNVITGINTRHRQSINKYHGIIISSASPAHRHRHRHIHRHTDTDTDRE
jgi:hypothetical protein